MTTFMFNTHVRYQNNDGSKRNLSEMIHRAATQLKKKFPELMKTLDKSNWSLIVPGGMDARLVSFRPNVVYVNDANEVRERLELEYEIIHHSKGRDKREERE